jgi:thiopurine S-methyltransferase
MSNWIQRWKVGSIGWHRLQPNQKLIKFIDCLKLNTGDTVFVPLCGKSVDMAYFIQQGYKIIGVELSSLAIEQFFAENNIEYQVHQQGEFSVYCGEHICIYCGDYFNLTAEHLKKVVAVYDRAALIALPFDLRVKYAQHLYSIMTNDYRILLLTLNYPQSQISGPPFAVNQKEVSLLYDKWFECQQLSCINDIENEPKFKHANGDFNEKATYCLHKNKDE